MGTDPQHLKITVTRDDVVAALLAKGSRNLSSMADIAHAVVVLVHQREDVWDGKEALAHVKQAEFKRLLASMVDDGALIVRTTTEWWALGAPTAGTRRGGQYYALPEKVREWEAAREHKAAQALQMAAEEHARRALAERYPEEFETLMRNFMDARSGGE